MQSRKTLKIAFSSSQFFLVSSLKPPLQRRNESRVINNQAIFTFSFVVNDLFMFMFVFFLSIVIVIAIIL